MNAIRFSEEAQRVLTDRVGQQASAGTNVFLRDAHGQLWMRYDALVIASHTTEPNTTVMSYYFQGKHIVSLDIPGSIGPNSLVLKGVNAQIAIAERADAGAPVEPVQTRH